MVPQQPMDQVEGMASIQHRAPLHWPLHRAPWPRRNAALMSASPHMAKRAYSGPLQQCTAGSTTGTPIPAHHLGHSVQWHHPHNSSTPHMWPFPIVSVCISTSAMGVALPTHATEMHPAAPTPHHTHPHLPPPSQSHTQTGIICIELHTLALVQTQRKRGMHATHQPSISQTPISEADPRTKEAAGRSTVQHTLPKQPSCAKLTALSLAATGWHWPPSPPCITSIWTGLSIEVPWQRYCGLYSTPSHQGHTSPSTGHGLHATHWPQAATVHAPGWWLPYQQWPPKSCHHCPCPLPLALAAPIQPPTASPACLHSPMPTWLAAWVSQWGGGRTASRLIRPMDHITAQSGEELKGFHQLGNAQLPGTLPLKWQSPAPHNIPRPWPPSSLTTHTTCPRSVPWLAGQGAILQPSGDPTAPSKTPPWDRRALPPTHTPPPQHWQALLRLPSILHPTGSHTITPCPSGLWRQRWRTGERSAAT